MNLFALPSRYEVEVQNGDTSGGSFPFRDVPIMSKTKLGINEGARVGAFQYRKEYAQMMRELIRGDIFPQV